MSKYAPKSFDEFPRLKSLLDSHEVYVEDGTVSYIGKTPTGEIILGTEGYETHIEEYLKYYPTPEKW